MKYFLFAMTDEHFSFFNYLTTGDITKNLLTILMIWIFYREIQQSKEIKEETKNLREDIEELKTLQKESNGYAKATLDFFQNFFQKNTKNTRK